jgi:hypothetical protein
LNASPHIRLSADAIASLLAGEVVETTFRGPRCPARGGSYPVLLQETTRLHVVVTGSKLRPHCKRVWTLSAVLDRAQAPLLLNAESAGGVITPLTNGSESAPAAHGYLDNPGSAVLDAGEAVPHRDVETSTKSQAAAIRHATSKVDSIQKRRARSLGKRVEDALLKARAHGADPDVEQLEGWLESLEADVEKAAA